MELKKQLKDQHMWIFMMKDQVKNFSLHVEHSQREPGGVEQATVTRQLTMISYSATTGKSANARIISRI